MSEPVDDIPDEEVPEKPEDKVPEDTTEAEVDTASEEIESEGMSYIVKLILVVAGCAAIFYIVKFVTQLIFKVISIAFIVIVIIALIVQFENSTKEKD
jgi:hypothetical protein